MPVLHSHTSLLIAALWYGINGILHDIFVIRQHKTGYDKNLMRLLMDGHVLLLSGALLLLGWRMINQSILWGYGVGAIVSFGMIIYCVMIWPFLKSIVTLFISIILFTICMANLFF